MLGAFLSSELSPGAVAGIIHSTTGMADVTTRGAGGGVASRAASGSSTVVSAADEKNGGREVAIKIVVCLLHLPHSLRAPFWNVLAVLLVAGPVCVLAPNAWRCYAAGRLAYDAAGAWD